MLKDDKIVDIKKNVLLANILKIYTKLLDCRIFQSNKYNNVVKHLPYLEALIL